MAVEMTWCGGGVNSNTLHFFLLVQIKYRGYRNSSSRGTGIAAFRTVHTHTRDKSRDYVHYKNFRKKNTIYSDPLPEIVLEIFPDDTATLFNVSPARQLE